MLEIAILIFKYFFPMSLGNSKECQAKSPSKPFHAFLNQMHSVLAIYIAHRPNLIMLQVFILLLCLDIKI